MLKSLVWGAFVAGAGAAALFVPIDPAVLQAVGIATDEATVETTQSQSPRSQQNQKIVAAQLAAVQSGKPRPPSSRLEVRVVPASEMIARDSGNASRSSQQAMVNIRAPEDKRRADTGATSGRFGFVIPAPRQPALSKSDQVRLIRSLQAELRRVGCYAGRVDGDWGPASRFAMSAFTKAANAALPTDEPDAVLLTLVRRHTGGACGQVPGRSHTTRVVTSPSNEGWKTRTVRAAPQLVTPPRMASRTPALVSGPRVVRADGSLSSTTATIRIVGTGNGSATSAPSIDAGRMALGAPLPPGEPAISITRSLPSAARPRRASPRYSARSYTAPRRVRRRAYRSRSRGSWQRRALRAINLNGS